MKTRSTWQLILGLIILTSCSTKYYIPNSQNVPMIKEKGEANINAVGAGGQAELQAAYGITDGIAVQANGVVVFPQDEDNGNGGKGHLIEGGIGFYKNFNEHFLFDTYLLGGFGYMENHFPGTVNDHPNTTGMISANIARYGLQPSFSWFNDNFSVSGSARFVNLTYSNIDGSLIFDSTEQSACLRDNKSVFLIEPALTIRGVSKTLNCRCNMCVVLISASPIFRRVKSC